jgi:uncharacterized DUF497 family protein/DNA-binding XRE family transcriptional regulator
MGHVDLLRMPAVAISKEERAFFKRLGARVAELRKERDITQVQLAEHLGISQQTVNAYERGSSACRSTSSSARRRRPASAGRHRSSSDSSSRSADCRAPSSASSSRCSRPSFSRPDKASGGDGSDAEPEGSPSGQLVSFQYHFTWDPAKAAANRDKHGVSFELAATLFRDPLAVSVYDDEHSSDNEDRWITLGQADNGTLLVVVHTFEETGDDAAEIRLGARGHSQRAKSVRERLTTMRSEYDFSNGERGKFFRKDAEVHLPVYLEDEVLAYLQERARAKGVGLNEFVNNLLKQDIALIEAAK